MQGKITEADTPTIWLGTTPSRLISDPPPSSLPHFMPDTLPAATLPIYPGFGQAPNMLACIPIGLSDLLLLQIFTWLGILQETFDLPLLTRCV